MQNVWQSVAGFPQFILYFALVLLLLAVFFAIYQWVTPYHETSLIREGNTAAAITLSGAIVGFVLPLASAVAHSVNPLDMIVWGVIAMLTQIAIFLVVCRIIPGTKEAIPHGKVAPATLLASVSISVGILNAVCITY